MAEIFENSVVRQAGQRLQVQDTTQAQQAKTQLWNGISQTIGNATGQYIQAVNQDEMSQAQVEYTDRMQKYQIAQEQAKLQAVETQSTNPLEGGAMSVDQGTNPATMMENQIQSYEAFSEELKTELMGNMSFKKGKESMNLWLTENINSTGNQLKANLVQESIGIMNLRATERVNFYSQDKEYGLAKQEVITAEEQGIMSHTQAQQLMTQINIAEARTTTYDGALKTIDDNVVMGAGTQTQDSYDSLFTTETSNIMSSTNPHLSELAKEELVNQLKVTVDQKKKVAQAQFMTTSNEKKAEYYFKIDENQRNGVDNRPIVERITHDEALYPDHAISLLKMVQSNQTTRAQNEAGVISAEARNFLTNQGISEDVRYGSYDHFGFSDAEREQANALVKNSRNNDFGEQMQASDGLFLDKLNKYDPNSQKYKETYSLYSTYLREMQKAYTNENSLQLEKDELSQSLFEIQFTYLQMLEGEDLTEDFGRVSSINTRGSRSDANKLTNLAHTGLLVNGSLSAQGREQRENIDKAYADLLVRDHSDYALQEGETMYEKETGIPIYKTISGYGETVWLMPQATEEGMVTWIRADTPEKIAYDLPTDAQYREASLSLAGRTEDLNDMRGGWPTGVYSGEEERTAESLVDQVINRELAVNALWGRIPEGVDKNKVKTLLFAKGVEETTQYYLDSQKTFLGFDLTASASDIQSRLENLYGMTAEEARKSQIMITQGIYETDENSSYLANNSAPQSTFDYGISGGTIWTP